MSNLVQLQGGSKSYGPKVLFDQAAFSINEGEHVGVIGPNGAGKTTLFKVLAEQESLDDGQLVTARGLRIGYLAQHDEWKPGESVEQYLSTARKPIWELKSLGRGLNLPDDIYEKPVTSLSGGYRMRCKLLYLLGQEPDLMLLDEPTNYLDLDSVMVLENFLQDYRSAFLLISHDREFLRRTTDHILEVEAGEITKFNGNLDDYFEQKALLREQLETRALSIQEKRKEILDFVNRFGAKATKARQAQSRLKSLSRLETIELKPLPVTAAIRIPPPSKTGKLIMDLREVSLGYGEKVVLRDVSFAIRNGDHLAVVGVNGAGKSTFLKGLSRVLEPMRGTIEYGYQVSIGYYAQHVSEALNPEHTVIQAIEEKAHPEVTRQDALNLAGSLLFSGDDVQKKVAVLSGGEKSRVALGQILLQKSPCLILDEPTNHLDFQTVEALTQALASYAGTVIVVSHDRSFIRRVGTKILEIRDGTVDLYPGTYDDYVWSLQKGILAGRGERAELAAGGARQGAASDSDILSTQGASRAGFNYKETKKNLDKQLRQAERRLAELEKSIQDAQKKIQALNEKLAAGGTGADGAKMIAEMGEIQSKLDADEVEWLEVVENKESLDTEIQALMAGGGG